MSSEMSDKRREVARRLREYPVHPAVGGKGGFPLRALAMLSGLLDATGLRQDEPARLYGRLADLIDPTCENKAIAINRRTPPEFRTDNLICSCCGTTFFADSEGINFPIDWAFCPECGARVVSDDDE